MNYKGLIESIIESILKERKVIASGNSYISKWNSWYRGNVNSFHNYTVYNGSEYVKMKKLSLGMAKRGCEDWASLLMNDKVEITIKEKEALTKMLYTHDFWNKANKAVEYGFALSMSALVVDFSLMMDEAGKVIDGDLRLNVYNANHIVPITFDNEVITECAFVNENTNDTILAIHLLAEDGTYEITVVTVDNASNKQTQSVFKTQRTKPFFTIIHPNIVNNIDIDSPYPISIFANAIDTLMAIDNKYDSFNNEFVLGRKRVYISAKAQKVNKQTGQIEKTFDPKDVVFYQLPEDTAMGVDKPFVKTDADALRAADHESAIQEELNIFASRIGLGNDYYNFNKGRVMTATQVISEKSDTFRNKQRHEILLEKNVTTIVEALIYANNTFTKQPKVTYEEGNIEVKFDDSIVEDKETQKVSDRADVTGGIMSKIEYRMKWYGETEEIAKKTVDKFYGDVSLANRITLFLPALQTGAMTPTQFVDLVYVDTQNKPELVTAITELLKTGGQVTPEEVAGAGFYTPPATRPNQEE